MTLKNKYNITDSTELARTEEKISKKKAVLLFESGYLYTLKAGTSRHLCNVSKKMAGNFTALDGPGSYDQSK